MCERGWIRTGEYHFVSILLSDRAKKCGYRDSRNWFSAVATMVAISKPAYLPGRICRSSESATLNRSQVVVSADRSGHKEQDGVFAVCRHSQLSSAYTAVTLTDALEGAD